MAKKIKVIGLGADPDKHPDLPSFYLDSINNAGVLAGGQRLLEAFPDFKGKRLVLKERLRETLKNYLESKEAFNDMVVLASGDPFFFGIGSLITSLLKDSALQTSEIQLEVFPSVSSVQLAFARAQLSWQDARFISVHGRSKTGLAQKIFQESKIAILTDENNHPGEMARYLLDYNLDFFDAFIGQDLGTETEKCQWYDLSELALKTEKDFSALNILILLRNDSFNKDKNNFTYFGIPDTEFSFPQKPDGLITKKEIRTLTLSALNLNKKSVVWDIGSCTGSVAIEAARIAAEGRVFAIEKNPEHLAHFWKNAKKFHTDITVLENDAPNGLDDFSDPDAVFIGGSGGKLEQILSICAQRLKSNGRIVVNAVTLETLDSAKKFFRGNNFSLEVNMVQIARSKEITSLTAFTALNPIFILTACRNESL